MDKLKQQMLTVEKKKIRHRVFRTEPHCVKQQDSAIEAMLNAVPEYTAESMVFSHCVDYSHCSDADYGCHRIEEHCNLALEKD